RDVGGTDDALDPAELFEQTLALARSSSSARGWSVDRDYREAPPVRGSRAALLQILVNLVVNARDAVLASEGERRVTLRIGPLLDGRVSLQVADTGVGLDPAVVERIWEHGYTTKTSGHGFGLSSCR